MARKSLSYERALAAARRRLRPSSDPGGYVLLVTRTPSAVARATVVTRSAVIELQDLTATVMRVLALRPPHHAAASGYVTLGNLLALIGKDSPRHGLVTRRRLVACAGRFVARLTHQGVPVLLMVKRRQGFRLARPLAVLWVRDDSA